MSGSFRSIVTQNAVLVVAITTRIHLVPDRSAKTSRMAVSYAIVSWDRHSVLATSQNYGGVPETRLSRLHREKA